MNIDQTNKLVALCKRAIDESSSIEFAGVQSAIAWFAGWRDEVKAVFDEPQDGEYWWVSFHDEPPVPMLVGANRVYGAGDDDGEGWLKDLPGIKFHSRCVFTPPTATTP